MRYKTTPHSPILRGRYEENMIWEIAVVTIHQALLG
jgi:hypothetical protein